MNDHPTLDRRTVVRPAYEVEMTREAIFRLCKSCKYFVPDVIGEQINDQCGFCRCNEE